MFKVTSFSFKLYSFISFKILSISSKGAFWIKFSKVILLGAETNSSVLFTAENLKYEGYNVEIPEPLVIARDDFSHTSAISLIADVLGIKVTGG